MLTKGQGNQAVYLPESTSEHDQERANQWAMDNCWHAQSFSNWITQTAFGRDADVPPCRGARSNGPISNKRTICLQSTHITNLIYLALVRQPSTFPMALWSLFKTLHKFKTQPLLDESWDLKASDPPTAWPRTSWLHSPHHTRGTSQHWCSWTANNYTEILHQVEGGLIWLQLQGLAW